MQVMDKIRKKAMNNDNEGSVTIAFLGDSVTQGCFEIYPNGEEIGVVFDWQNRKIIIYDNGYGMPGEELIQSMAIGSSDPDKARDFYDLYVLYTTRKDEIRKGILKLAVEHTAQKRGSLEEIKDYKAICQEILEEDALNRLWNNYAKENGYAAQLDYKDMVNTVLAVGEFIEES